MRRVLLTGLIVGALDITEVILFYWFRGVAPARILKGIAGGVLGRGAALAGGADIALLGLALHYFIAFVVVIVYWLCSRRIALLRERPILCGALYGVAVWAFMSYVVVPMSALGPPQRLLPPWPMLANTLFAHVFCVGIPTAVLLRR